MSKTSKTSGAQGNFFAEKLRTSQNRIAEILEWECFNTSEQRAKRKFAEENELWNATDFLECKRFTEGEGVQYSLQLLCQNISNGNFFEYERLYNEAEIIELYMFLARANALNHSNKED